MLYSLSIYAGQSEFSPFVCVLCGFAFALDALTRSNASDEDDESLLNPRKGRMNEKSIAHLNARGASQAIIVSFVRCVVVVARCITTARLLCYIVCDVCSHSGRLVESVFLHDIIIFQHL